MYSQVGQDDWVLSLFSKDYKGFFVDFGCQMPQRINNTLLLEEHGWDGVSFDIVNYSEDWKTRRTKFVCDDLFTCDFEKYGIPKVIDYLSLDISPYVGCRYDALKRFIELGYEFKTLTIEHNYYMNNVDLSNGDHNLQERLPQRDLLFKYGYIIANADVEDHTLPLEDWWINTKYFDIVLK